ncbi:MAG: glycosyltransferase family 2 protein [Lachnospiraceae bacterium]
MALVSVIIPCYNVENYIDRCLTTVTSQTIGLENLEIICIDDASTDNTLEKLKQWEKRYPDNIILISSEVNGRQGRARNIGLQYATADWVNFMDSDDWLEPDFYEKMYRIGEELDCDLVVCQSERDFSRECTYFKERNTGKKSRCLVIDSVEKRKIFLVLKSVAYLLCSKLLRRSLLIENEILFPEYLTYEDTYWDTMVHLYVSKAYILEEKLYHYFVNDRSTVLQKASDHHVDLLTVQSMLWEDCKRRGFFKEYKDALEYDFLHGCYLGFLKIIVFRYEEPSYSYFLLLKEFIITRIGDYRKNYFINEIEQPDFYKLIFEALLLPMNKVQFLELAGYIRRIGL